MKNKIIAFIKRKNESIHTTETIYIASILTMVGGFVDAYTYITRGGVFAYAQTGNIIFFAMDEFLKNLQIFLLKVHQKI